MAPVPPPPTHEIVAEQRSRFGTVESLQTANSSNNVADESNATIDYYNIMLKYFLDQANNMPNMKMRVNFAKHNNLKTGVASGAAQG